MKQDRESPIQRAIVAYLRRVLPDAIVHHSPNEGVRGGKAGWLDGALAKSAGQVAGFPDLIVIPWANIGPLFLGELYTLLPSKKLLVCVEKSEDKT